MSDKKYFFGEPIGIPETEPYLAFYNSHEGSLSICYLKGASVESEFVDVLWLKAHERELSLYGYPVTEAWIDTHLDSSVYGERVYL